MKNDNPLSDLLHAWKAPPVPGDFDQNVLRRIRLQQPSAPAPGWRGWLLAPARIAAAAALAAVLAGGWAGWRVRPAADPNLAFARPGSVTGSYLHLSHRGSP